MTSNIKALVIKRRLPVTTSRHFKVGTLFTKQVVSLPSTSFQSQICAETEGENDKKRAKKKVFTCLYKFLKRVIKKVNFLYKDILL